jgi:hypothetical protein
VQPGARLVVVAADESVERAVKSKEQESELAFLSLRIERAATSQPRHGRLARPDDLGQLFVTEA